MVARPRRCHGSTVSTPRLTAYGDRSPAACRGRAGPAVKMRAMERYFATCGRGIEPVLADELRELGAADVLPGRGGGRPRVDVDEPMVGLNLHIYKDQATLSLESSGESLHKRGYRPILTRAPLNEALAAALVLRTGWRGATAFADPLCGSGTLPIEAAWIALARPPGLTRKRFGFMGWMDFDV